MHVCTVARVLTTSSLYVRTLILSDHCLQCTMKNMAKPLVVICRDNDFEGGQSEEEMKMFVRARIREFLS